MSRHPHSHRVTVLCILAIGVAFIVLATFGPAPSRFVFAMLGLVCLGSGIVQFFTPGKPPEA